MRAPRTAARSLILQAITAISLVWCGCAWGQAAEARQEPLSEQELGRLFHTPQQRAVLDELRRRNARISREQQSDTITLQGIVRRSSGRSTVWINGQAHSEHAPVASYGDRSARVFVGEGKTVELKVGEQVKLTPESSTEKRP
ncbi:hypothetical protein Q9Q94_16920 [Uliginosibacterium sp. 31-16]|uniref:hypothetical protein n=1 Tax=Uliginosibacterium sp. 31-16 TaxID=3068315 RepID=UPI0027401B6E|nr:hypothetical protein [Uliginosibacterium sp. 31-16]MDP5241225.1 hypothetical protein [Uliginosibacterium sp. 31-16]